MRCVLLSLLLWTGAAGADSAAQPPRNSRFIGFGEDPSEEAFVAPGVAVSRSRRTLAIYLPNRGDADDSDVGGALVFVSLDDLRELPGHIALGPYTGEAMRRLRYAAVNERLAQAGFEVLKGYEYSSWEDFDPSAFQAPRYASPNEPVAFFARSQLVVTALGHAYRHGREVSFGKRFGRVFGGWHRGLYLPRQEIVVVWSAEQHHGAEGDVLVRRVRF
jgi:hypothetical protein